MRYGSTVLRLIGLAIVRPALGWALLRTAWRFRSADWYRRPPFLPLPPAPYLAWRMKTAWGDEEHQPGVAELERYLRWVLWMRPRGRR
jgi:hypothetical protein